MAPKQQFNGPFEAAAADVYALISTPFEGDFEPQNYRAEFSLDIAVDAPFFASKVHTYLQRFSEIAVDNRQAWQAHIGYDDKSASLVFNRVELPLKSRASQLVLQRMNGGEYPGDYLPLLKKGGKETPIELLFIDTIAVQPVAQQAVTAALGLTGYALPQVFAAPDDLRLYLAELSDNSSTWTVTEERTIPETVDSVLHVTRRQRCQTQNARRVFTTALEAAIQSANEGQTNLRRTIFRYEVLDYVVTKPTIEEVSLAHTDTTILCEEGTNVYTVTGKKDVEPTSASLREWSGRFIDILS